MEEGEEGGSVGLVDGGGGMSVECGKVPQMSRQRLQQIRRHLGDKGEYVLVLLCLIVVLCRCRPLWHVLGDMLSLS